jgi:bifunctional non-homologous end joining protein LigD
MGLQRYKQKRNFTATPEPAGKVERRKKSALMFVIQKHDASRLHYDFRLEIGGVLASWAVPKGVPTTKGDRRLAMHVEDHPIDYGDFEGIIPEGNYGAGSVMVWDTGTWEPLGGDPAEDVKAGKLHFALHGKKLEGEWTLVRMRARSEASGKDEWLLLKSGEDVTPISAKQDDESVLTRRTMAQIAGQKTRTWQSNRTAAPPSDFKARIAAAANKRAGARTVTSARTKRSRKSSKDDDTAGEPATPSAPTERRDDHTLLDHCPKETPCFIDPMKARLIEKLPREDWLLELKHDGFRVIAIKNGNSVELFSRNYKPLTGAFPHVADAVRKLAPKQFVLDGEVVALNERGYGSFQLLQNRESITDPSTIVFYVFDLLNLDGRSTRNLLLTQRRALLEPLIAKAGDPIRYSATLNGSADAVLEQVRRLSLEGIIAKKPESKYEPGQRSGAWVKVKVVNEQEFVIGGYTPPKGSRDHFGSIVVGYYDGGKLFFASKVGSGFNQSTLRELYKTFQPLRRATCPFVNLPSQRGGRFGQGISRAEMGRCTWLEPELVAQIRFSEWTSDDGLRHPVFLGLRHDKRAQEVTRERAGT